MPTTLYHRTLSQFLQGLPAQPVHIAGLSFTTPALLSSYTPHKGSGVYVWLSPPGDPRALGTVVFSGMAEDLAKWDFDRQNALDKWQQMGRSQTELSVAVHHLPHASRAELMAVEQRLVALLHPTLNRRASNDSQQFDAFDYKRSNEF
jgi:hypothetical protein